MDEVVFGSILRNGHWGDDADRNQKEVRGFHGEGLCPNLYVYGALMCT
jgi:hypothetical protein